MLTDLQKEKLIEQNRYINVEHDWWEFTIEDFIAVMQTVGITVGRKPSFPLGNRDYPEVYFSGFNSQGDGACFAGYVDDWTKFFEVHSDSFGGIDSAYVMTYPQAILECEWHHGSSRYCRENTLGFSIIIEENEYFDNEPSKPLDLPEAAALALYKKFDAAGFEDTIEEIVKGYCRELYRTLEREHDYLTSDEVVWESIVANDLHLDIEEEA